MKARRVPFPVSRDLEFFWGRPLGEIDIQLCEVLGWAELVGKSRRRCWRLTEKTKCYDGQIYRNGNLLTRDQLQVDKTIFDFLWHYQRADLDPFLGRGEGEFRLRLILTLV